MIRALKRGMSGLVFLLLFFVLLILLFLGDMGFILFNACGRADNPVDCVITVLTEPKEEPAPEGSATAVGTATGEYAGAERSVTFRLIFPLEGGKVTGTFSGDCDGTIEGMYTIAYDGQGTISGTGSGSCGLILPASGSFSGKVYSAPQHTVEISGKGSAGGFSGEGSLTLYY